MKNITLKNNKLLLAIIILIILIVLIECSPASSAENINEEESPIKPVIKCKETATINESIIFDASESYSNEGNITSYLWQFGDGTQQSTKMVTSHVYKKAGRYPVMLYLTDNKDNHNHISATINIETETDETVIQSDQNKGSFFQIDEITQFIKQKPFLITLIFVLIISTIAAITIRKKHNKKTKNQKNISEQTLQDKDVYKIKNYEKMIKPKSKRKDGLRIRKNIKPKAAGFNIEEKENIDVFNENLDDENNLKEESDDLLKVDSFNSSDNNHKNNKDFETKDTEIRKLDENKLKTDDEDEIDGVLKSFDFSDLADDEDAEINLKEINAKKDFSYVRSNESKIKKKKRMHSSRSLSHRHIKKDRKSISKKQKTHSLKKRLDSDKNLCTDEDVKEKVHSETKPMDKQSKNIKKIKKESSNIENNRVTEKKESKRKVNLQRRSRHKSLARRNSDKSSKNHRKHRTHASKRYRLNHKGVSC